jgi:uncharacterized LabA/DUF88 family protein
MKPVAVLLDGGFLVKKLYRILGHRHADAKNVLEFARACVKSPEEELFRIYYYDCPPFSEAKTNPISRIDTDFSTTPTFTRCTRLQEDLKHSDHVAFRAGHLIFGGWAISRVAMEKMLRTPRPVQADDLEPVINQKRVDMKIGLDIAWLASKSIVKKLILATADTDFVPAMKFARREGVQVVIATLDGRLRRELREHADEVRMVKIAIAAQAKKIIRQAARPQISN